MTDAESNPPQQSPDPGLPAKGNRGRWKMWRMPPLSAEVIQDRRIRKWSELLETVVLTIATLATVWAGYQAGQWNGLQTTLNIQATSVRIESTQLTARAQQLQLIDVGLFTNWVNAFGSNNSQLADFYRNRFRDEFAPVFSAWLATEPLANPDAPGSPFDMPEYHVAVLDEADALIEEAGRLTQVAERAGTIGDQYTLSVVILAGSLLLAGLANRFEWAELRAVVVSAGLLILLYSVANIIRLPVA